MGRFDEYANKATPAKEDTMLILDKTGNSLKQASLNSLVDKCTFVIDGTQKTLKTALENVKQLVGTPATANTVAEMTDTTKIYVYTGSETGYTNGNWYFHNGTAWVSGGIYNSSALSTDKTLSLPDQAADAKATGDVKNVVESIRDLKKVTFIDYNDFVFGSINSSSGGNTAATNPPTVIRCTNYIADAYDISSFDSLYCTITPGYKTIIYFYDSERTHLAGTRVECTTSKVVPIPSNACYTRFNLSKVPSSEITLEEVVNVSWEGLYTIQKEILGIENDVSALSDHVDASISQLSSDFEDSISQLSTSVNGSITQLSNHVDDSVETLTDLIEENEEAAETSINQLSDTVNEAKYGVSVPLEDFEKGSYKNQGKDKDNTTRKVCRLRTTGSLVFERDVVITALENDVRIWRYYMDAEGLPTDAPYVCDPGDKIIVKANSYFRLCIDGAVSQRDTPPTMTEAEIYAKFTITSPSLFGTERNIEKLADHSVIVPDYYFENNYLDNKCLEAQIATGKGVVSFGFITDTHMDDSCRNSMKLAKYISDRTGALPFMIFGGDVITSQTNGREGLYDQAMKWQQMLAEFGKDRVYQCRGNHDFISATSGAGILTYGESRSLIVGSVPNNAVFGKPDVLYYYFDVPGTNIRFIVLDNYSAGHNRDSASPTSAPNMTSDEFNWLANEALDVQEKDIVVVCHHPTNVINEYYETDTTESVRVLGRLLSAFVKRKADYTEDYGSLAFDFSSYTSRLVCVLSGHRHEDKIGYDQNFVTIITEADARYAKHDEDRLMWTTNEGAFDIISLDIPIAKGAQETEEQFLARPRTVYCTRIGALKNRIIHLTPVTDVSSPLVPEAVSETYTWTSAETKVATVNSSGAVTIVSPTTFNSSVLYATGDYAIHDNKLYKYNAKTMTSAEEWNATKWVEVSERFVSITAETDDTTETWIIKIPVS